MPIGGQEVVGACPDVREIAPAATGDQDLAPGLGRMVDEEDPASSLSRQAGTKHSGGTGANDDYVEGKGCAHSSRSIVLCVGGDGGIRTLGTGIPRTAV